MIVMILVLIWVVALTPFLLRRLSEHQISTSVSKFRAATRMLRRAYPKLTSVATGNHATAARSGQAAARRRADHQRARRQIERRKQLLLRLLGGTGGSFVLGGLPHLHKIWDLSIVGALLTIGYVGALAYLARQPAPLPTMRHAGLTPRARAQDRGVERLAAAGGGTSSFAEPVPRRPAFVVIRPDA